MALIEIVPFSRLSLSFRSLSPLKNWAQPAETYSKNCCPSAVSSIPILLRKIAAVLRRTGGEARANRLQFRDLTLDLDAVQAWQGQTPLELTAREFELLQVFLASPGRVFTREVLLAKLWGYDFFGDERVVDSHIKNLRRKLGGDYIETVRGVGYRAAGKAP